MTRLRKRESLDSNLFPLIRAIREIGAVKESFYETQKDRRDGLHGLDA